jgi:hypothetical protein
MQDLDAVLRQRWISQFPQAYVSAVLARRSCWLCKLCLWPHFGAWKAGSSVHFIPPVVIDLFRIKLLGVEGFRMQRFLVRPFLSCITPYTSSARTKYDDLLLNLPDLCHVGLHFHEGSNVIGCQLLHWFTDERLLALYSPWSTLHQPLRCGNSDRGCVFAIVPKTLWQFPSSRELSWPRTIWTLP